MKKGYFRDNIEKIVRLLTRPMMNGKKPYRLSDSGMIYSVHNSFETG